MKIVETGDAVERRAGVTVTASQAPRWSSTVVVHCGERLRPRAAIIVRVCGCCRTLRGDVDLYVAAQVFDGIGDHEIAGGAQRAGGQRREICASCTERCRASYSREQTTHECIGVAVSVCAVAANVTLLWIAQAARSSWSPRARLVQASPPQPTRSNRTHTIADPVTLKYQRTRGILIGNRGAAFACRIHVVVGAARAPYIARRITMPLAADGR